MTETISAMPVPAAPPPPSAGSRIFSSRTVVPQRHLVMINQPGWQAPEDFYEIAATVVKLEPSIAVVVASAAAVDPATLDFAARLPTLVFSPGPTGAFRARRGKVYHGGTIPKFEQLRRLHAAGVRVPLTTALRPDTRLDPAEWGPLVIVKPTDIHSSSRGHGIQLMRTEAVRYREPNDYPEDHPGRRAPMLVQQFVDTGPRISCYRVLTLFGRPLYCTVTESDEDRVDLAAPDPVLEAANIATQSLAEKRQEFVYKADVVALAAAAYRAIPEAPLQGVDILRQAGSGKVFVLELNPGGNTWHFSSNHAAERRAREPRVNELRHTQLDAFGTAAHILVERTVAEAM